MTENKKVYSLKKSSKNYLDLILDSCKLKAMKLSKHTELLSIRRRRPMGV
jgi:hypothetical protein